MWCVSLAPDAWNLSGHCQRGQDTQDARDAGDTTQDRQDAGDVGDETQDTQDAGDRDSTSHVSGRNSAVSEEG